MDRFEIIWVAIGLVVMIAFILSPMIDAKKVIRPAVGTTIIEQVEFPVLHS